MKISDRRIKRLEADLQKAIDNICETEDYQVDYHEIVFALIRVTGRMNEKSMKLMKESGK